MKLMKLTPRETSSKFQPSGVAKLVTIEEAWACTILPPNCLARQLNPTPNPGMTPSLLSCPNSSLSSFDLLAFVIRLATLSPC